jgi:hypothetical protein
MNFPPAIAAARLDGMLRWFERTRAEAAALEHDEGLAAEGRIPQFLEEVILPRARTYGESLFTAWANGRPRTEGEARLVVVMASEVRALRDYKARAAVSSAFNKLAEQPGWHVLLDEARDLVDWNDPIGALLEGLTEKQKVVFVLRAFAGVGNDAGPGSYREIAKRAGTSHVNILKHERLAEAKFARIPYLVRLWLPWGAFVDAEDRERLDEIGQQINLAQRLYGWMEGSHVHIEDALS